MADESKNKNVTELGGLKVFFTTAKTKFIADLSTTDKTRVGDMIETIIKGLAERIKELAPEKKDEVTKADEEKVKAKKVKPKRTPKRRRTR